MISHSMRIRPFNRGAGFEIVLPNNKAILIDPFFSCVTFESGQTRDDVTGADYILLTHSHFDHDIDLGYFVRKFDSKVFCGAISAEEILKFHKIPYDNLFPVFPGQIYHLDDFILKAWQAKHNPNGGKIFEPNLDLTSRYGITGHTRCDQLGSLESLDFMITTYNHFSVLMASGRIVWQDTFEVCRKEHPNVLLRQAGFRRMGDLFSGEQISAEELAAIFIKYGAQVIFPFHHDVLVARWGLEATEKYFDDVAREVSRLDPGAKMVNPKEWKWYDIGISVT